MSIGKLQNRGGNFVARLGGADVLKQEELSKLTPEQMVQYNQQREAARNVGMRELAARLSDAFAGRDVAGRAAARRPMIEAEKRQEEQNKKVDDAIDKSNLPQSQKDLLKSLNLQTKTQALMETYKPKTEDIPADIKKLNQLQVLRTKFDPKSPNYDPNYTEEKYNQEASILGVSANLLKPAKEKYKAEYMKQMRTVKGAAGRPMYTEEQLEQMAESSYNTLYKSTPKGLTTTSDTDEEIIDLGKI